MMSKTRKATFAKPSSLPTKLAVALSAVVATQAYAADYPNHQFGLYYRMDLQINSTDPKDEKIEDNAVVVDENETGTNTKFAANTLRINFTGDLTDATSYRVRFRPSRATNDTDVDGLGRSVDYIYLTHNVNENFSVRGGKFFWIGHCSREGDYNGQDVYLFSAACDGPDYMTGIGLMPTFAGQTLVISAVNGADEDESNHSNLGYGITWYGDFGDGMVQPIAYYATHPTTEQKQAQTVTSGTPPVTVTAGTKLEEATTNTYMGVGARFNFGMGFFEADYITKKVEGRDVTNAKDKETTSYALAARLMLMNKAFQPHIKYVMDKFDDDVSDKATTTSWDRNAYSIALEYYPEMYKDKGVDWRVHAVYTAKDYKFDKTGQDNFKSDQILLGIAFNFTNGVPKM